MSKDGIDMLLGEIIEHNSRIEQAEFQRLCRISEDFLQELIDEGIIEPEFDVNMNSNVQYFSAFHLQRVKRANRLNTELGVNVAGIALILELLDRIEYLER